MKPASSKSLPSSKFKLTIAYDGSQYAGWQVQKVGVGVQEKVEQALQKIFPDVKRIHSSSRTDTGVHALGMVAHVEIPIEQVKMPGPKLALAINAWLPEDIRVLSAVRCPAAFHARFDATGKQYRYFVWNDRVMNPLQQGRAWHVPQPLDLDAMKQAVRCFPGKHDFKSFAATRDYQMKSTVRKLTRCDLRKQGPLLTFIIEGEGFLYKMCRGIVGTIIQCGRGKYRPSEIRAMLAAKDRRAAGVNAPAHGLVLWKVFYRKKTRAKHAKIAKESWPRD